MKKYLRNLKLWYEQRITRERVLMLFLSISIMYALVYIIFFHHLEQEKVILEENLKQTNKQLQTLELQLDLLKKMNTTPLYKQWLKQQNTTQQLEQKYKSIVTTSTPLQLQKVIKTILQAKSDVTVLQIQNFPETLYNQSDTQSTRKIYEQKVIVGIYGNFFSTVAYLQYLEMQLKNIHWNNLHYEVSQYPNAKVEMEFSIFYEKPI